MAGLLLGYILDERREENRQRRERAMTTLPIRQSALKDVHDTMVDLGIAMTHASLRAEEFDRKEVQEVLDRFDGAFFRATIWMSNKNSARLSDAVSSLRDFAWQIIRGNALSNKQAEEFASALGNATAAIANDLHTEVLESQLRETFSKILRREEPEL